MFTINNLYPKEHQKLVHPTGDPFNELPICTTSSLAGFWLDAATRTAVLRAAGEAA